MILLISSFLGLAMAGKFDEEKAGYEGLNENEWEWISVVEGNQPPEAAEDEPGDDKAGDEG